MATDTSYDLGAILAAAGNDGGVSHGAALTAFVDAVLGDGAAVLADARSTLRRALGDAGYVDACATVASFNAVVKIADGTGISLEEAKEARTRDIRAALALDAFRC